MVNKNLDKEGILITLDGSLVSYILPLICPFRVLGPHLPADIKPPSAAATCCRLSP